MATKKWKVAVTAPAKRDIRRLPEKAATAVIETLYALAENPKRMGKPLRFELDGCWSARRGPYRVIYSLDERARLITVLAIDHRADIYRQR